MAVGVIMAVGMGLGLRARRNPSVFRHGPSLPPIPPGEWRGLRGVSLRRYPPYRPMANSEACGSTQAPTGRMEIDFPRPTRLV